jgi:hypothetical protein
VVDTQIPRREIHQAPLIVMLTDQDQVPHQALRRFFCNAVECPRPVTLRRAGDFARCFGVTDGRGCGGRGVCRRCFVTGFAGRRRLPAAAVARCRETARATTAVSRCR